jgi:hypothetical protein
VSGATDENRIKDAIFGDPVAHRPLSQHRAMSTGDTASTAATCQPGALAHAVSRTAEDATDDDRATELEAAGGRVIELGPADWRAIAA